MPEGLTLVDRTTDRSTLLVTGPTARTLFQALGTEADLALPWLSVQPARVQGIACTLARVSFAGELGWEIHADKATIPALYDAVLEAGATPFGMWALNVLRIEKGYRSWKGELSSDYDLIEAGLQRFIRFDKPQHFPGRAALLDTQTRGPARRFVALIVDAGAAEPPSMSPLVHDGDTVGAVTSAAWGHRVRASVALAMVRADLAKPGAQLEVESFGKLHRAVVQPECAVWDPSNARMRA